MGSYGFDLPCSCCDVSWSRQTFTKITVDGNRKILRLWLQTMAYSFIIVSWEILVGFFYFA